MNQYIPSEKNLAMHEKHNSPRFEPKNSPRNLPIYDREIDDRVFNSHMRPPDIRSNEYRRN